MLKLKLLERDEEGRLRPTENIHYPSPAKKDQAVRQLFAESIRYAAESLEAYEGQDSKYTAMAIGMKRENIGKARDLISRFWKDFGQLVEDVPGDSIYQLSIQFFPLTKK
jgi:uncharacterized protein (TIGR02147 family)